MIATLDKPIIKLHYVTFISRSCRPVESGEAPVGEEVLVCHICLAGQYSFDAVLLRGAAAGRTANPTIRKREAGDRPERQNDTGFADGPEDDPAIRREGRRLAAH